MAAESTDEPQSPTRPDASAGACSDRAAVGRTHRFLDAAPDRAGLSTCSHSPGVQQGTLRLRVLRWAHGTAHSTGPGVPCIAEPCSRGILYPSATRAERLRVGGRVAVGPRTALKQFFHAASGRLGSFRPSRTLHGPSLSTCVHGMVSSVEQLAAACATHLLPGAGAGLAAQAGQALARRMAWQSSTYATNAARLPTEDGRLTPHPAATECAVKIVLIQQGSISQQC